MKYLAFILFAIQVFGQVDSTENWYFYYSEEPIKLYTYPTLEFEWAFDTTSLEPITVLEPAWYEELPYFETNCILHSVVSGYSMYYQMKDRHYYKAGETELKEKYNRNWHISGGIELGLSLTLGGVSALKNKDNWLGYAKDLLLFSAIRWNVRDGVYNMLNGDSFYHQSENTTAMLEPLGYWYVKLGYLITAIIIYLL